MLDSGSPKRVVLSTYGSAGDLFPFLAIGAVLRERGYAVVVATSEHYRGSVSAAGLEFAAVRPDRIEGQRDPDFLERLRRDRVRPDDLFRTMFLPSLRESLEDLLGVVAGLSLIPTR
jgi:UDP:flavonoid glycosyltransferase YjiC (YdhE family)